MSALKPPASRCAGPLGCRAPGGAQCPAPGCTFSTGHIATAGRAAGLHLSPSECGTTRADPWAPTGAPAALRGPCPPGCKLQCARRCWSAGGVRAGGVCARAGLHPLPTGSWHETLGSRGSHLPLCRGGAALAGAGSLPGEGRRRRPRKLCSPGGGRSRGACAVEWAAPKDVLHVLNSLLQISEGFCSSERPNCRLRCSSG